MMFKGFEGPAGTGKTHRLIEEVGQHLMRSPLEKGQRVLALTFMHGSRKRLESRFREVPALQGRITCMTIDSFARSILQRWRSFAVEYKLDADGFDQTCEVCGELLEDPVVAEWVARTFPVVVVDEAQELQPERLRILKALEPHMSLFVAADEFQCLDERHDAGPFMEWFGSGCVEHLSVVHRTGMQGLLRAGVALRNLQSPRTGDGLSIRYEYKNVMPFAVVSSLSRASGTRALIYGPSGRAWADEIIERAGQGMQSKSYGTINPLKLIHEDRAEKEKQSILDALAGMDAVDSEMVLDALAAIPDPPPWGSTVRNAIVKAEQVQGRRSWDADDLTELVERKAAYHRAYGYQRPSGIPVMSIHQAKNREFDHVVLLWPPGVRGTNEQKARLLYNGVTRAIRMCRVFVRTQPLLSQPPFLF